MTEPDNTTSSQDDIKIWPGLKAAIPLFKQLSGNVYGNHKIFVGFQLFDLLEFNDFSQLRANQRSLYPNLKDECWFQLKGPAGTNRNQ
jgi:hypothetical protein